MQIGRKRQIILLAALALVPTSLAWAYCSSIVFDPSNLGENVRQVAALIDQIERATRQIRLQEDLLAPLRITVADEVVDAEEDLRIQLSGSFSRASDDLASEAAWLDVRYPLMPSGHQRDWWRNTASMWTGNERMQLVDELDLLSHVYRDMSPSTTRIQRIVEASNGKGAGDSDPGLTTTIQAHNQVLVATAGELDKYIALRLLRSRARLEHIAREQAERAQAHARREVLMSDWNPGTEPEPIRSPF